MEEEKEGDGSEAKKRKMEGGDNTSEENDEESNLFHMKQVYWGKIQFYIQIPSSEMCRWNHPGGSYFTAQELQSLDD